MAHKIEILSSDIANKIAAGEVVQRPLSVVKELVENSIDAESKNIKINLVNSGLDEIEIIDDGIGMNKENVELCLFRHATSKVKNEKDIYNIVTLGFRGEALPSIAAVSIFNLKTSVDGKEGYELIKEGDEEAQINEIVCNKGTSIKVSNLFFNTPARFKHLSSTFYELSLIIQYVNKAALTNPDIRFELNNNDNNIFLSLGDGNILNVMQKIYSTEIAKNVLEFSNENDDFRVDFYIVKPQITRSKKSNMHISVNNRIIRNIAIENMILKGYGTYLHTNQFPIVYINITTDFSLIDINIHPTKEQIKISLIDRLEELIVNSIKDILEKEEYISSPSVDSEISSNFLEDREEQALNNLFSNENDNNTLVVEPRNDSSVTHESEINSVDMNAPEKIEDISDSKSSFDLDDNTSSFGTTYLFEGNNVQDNISEEVNINKLDNNDIVENDLELSTQTLIENGVYIGRHHNTYIMYESEKGLYLVDQHAAQERIRYEELLEKFSDKEFKMQKVLIPQVFEFTEGEYLLVLEKLDDLRELGLVFEKFGPKSLRLVEVDALYLNVGNLKKQIRWIIETISQENKLTYEKIIDDIAISIACKGSIKAHDYITQNDAEILLAQLSKCKVPYTCPHGRPIIVLLSNYQIEKMFKRIF